MPRHPIVSDLHRHWAYTTRAELLSESERVKLAYERARALVRVWNLTAEEIATCAPRFWDLQRDPTLCLDVGASNLQLCHYNLFLGTIIPMLKSRPDLVDIVERGLRGEYFGNMLLTEVGHGLDVAHVETTATKTANGFTLNTPTPSAAKFMPPTTSIPGCAKLGIVFAKLLVSGEHRGVHPFLVTLCSEHGMCEGVRASPLPLRAGTSPLDYALTSFHNLQLPFSAFLGESLEVPKDANFAKFQLNGYIWRVSVGAMALSVSLSVASKFIANIGSDYSYRRHIQGTSPNPFPIISFRTQHMPMLYAVAIAHVLEAWMPHALQDFMVPGRSNLRRQGMAVVFKATLCRLLTSISPSVSERLGVQGTFAHNLLSQLEMDVRGLCIAEGDVLVTSIKVFAELVVGRYQLPSPTHPDTLLARHSADIFARCKHILASLSSHRDTVFNDLVLPQAESGVTALGHALAYSHAVDSGLAQPLLDLFECYAMKKDLVWYSEHAGISEEAFRRREDDAMRAALPHLPRYVDAMGVREWIDVPIASDRSWNKWVERLRVQRGSEPQLETSDGARQVQKIVRAHL